ncbi:MAG: DEAD/DEAH box helicase [Planctomycetes bacterium]|nr:DEAD/DEAH box helicase [Planctomycetota bacterium]
MTPNRHQSAAISGPSASHTETTPSGFAGLGLSDRLLRALADCGYHAPTPIQTQAIPHLVQGKDLLGIAQTGTGKTAAFALPTLDFLAHDRAPLHPREVRCLVLVPTRELASQVHESFRDYGKHHDLRYAVVFGGVGIGAQQKALSRGVDVLVATPGRLLDLMSQRSVVLRDVEVFVLDEADRMLDMGFIRDVRKIIDALPKDRQSLLFSATMPVEVVQLTKAILIDPVRVEVAPQTKTADKVEQSIYFVEKAQKRELLAKLLEDGKMFRTLVFTRTKHGADRVVRSLKAAGFAAAAIHGNKAQGARERALGSFKDGKVPVLVATDIAARGLDVDDISHVVNFDLPNVPETYVHRIGRTARAGRGGVALSFCDQEEREYLRDIEKLIGQSVPVVVEHAYRSTVPFAPARGGNQKGGSGPTGGSGQRGNAQKVEHRAGPPKRNAPRRGRGRARARRSS